MFWRFPGKPRSEWTQYHIAHLTVAWVWIFVMSVFLFSFTFISSSNDFTTFSHSFTIPSRGCIAQRKLKFLSQVIFKFLVNCIICFASICHCVNYFRTDFGIFCSRCYFNCTKTFFYGVNVLISSSTTAASFL